MIYRTCPHCGANLDPGETCDCRPALVTEAMRLIMSMTDEQCAAVMEQFKKEAPASATNTDRGGVDTSDQTISTSNDT